jgi:3-hydroxyisobutyrate dehydrogenase-like beta-hydroxyacid dehydrogenase
VQLTTGTPDDARQMQSWAQPLGIEYLDGAIISYPVDIGKPQSIVLYSGPEDLFNRIKPLLLAFGDNAMFVGKEIGNASAQDMVILAFVMGTMFSLLQGYAVYEAENLPVEGFMPFIKSLMPALEAALSGLTTTIRAKDYDNTQATLDVWAACPRELRKWCGDHRVDHSLVDPQISLMDEAIKDGKGHADFAYLYELLKKARTGQSARVSAS